jgi:hypothetical protein
MLRLNEVILFTLENEQGVTVFRVIGKVDNNGRSYITQQIMDSYGELKAIHKISGANAKCMAECITAWANTI